MSINTEENISITFAGTGLDQDFEIPFTYFLDPNNQGPSNDKWPIIVRRNGILLTMGGGADQYDIINVPPDRIATKEYPFNIIHLNTILPSGSTLTITRATPNTQPFTLEDPIAEEACDNLARQIQEIARTSGDFLRVPEALNGMSFRYPLQDGQALAWDQSSNEIFSSPFNPTQIQTDITNLSIRTSALEGRTSAIETALATTINSRLQSLENTDVSLQSQIDSINTEIDTLFPSLQGWIRGEVETQLTQALLPISQMVSDLITRQNSIENKMSYVLIQGSVAILNNQTTALDIPELTFDGNIYSSAFIEFEIRRFDPHGADEELDYRSGTGQLALAFRGNNTWIINRDYTTLNYDYTELTVDNRVGSLGVVQYTTDNLVGSTYEGYMNYRVKVFKRT